jgi:8-oxo-dGTP pyrophosphatase MutT (NUDIX family)
MSSVDGGRSRPEYDASVNSIGNTLRGSLSNPSPDPPLPDGVPAAVIVPVIDGDEPTLLLTKRTETVRDHKGEISFPGGARHPEDPDLLSTALRETHEELGIPPDAFEVLGALPPTHTMVSGYVIAPFVARLPARPVLRPSPVEIAEVLELPVTTLIDVEREVEAVGGLHRTMFVYEVDGHVVWGATGRIVHGFLEILRRNGWAGHRARGEE